MKKKFIVIVDDPRESEKKMNRSMAPTERGIPVSIYLVEGEMKKYKTNFTKEELQSALHSNSGEARAIIEDENKWSAFKTKFESFLKKAKKVPVLGNVIDDVTCMVELVESYVKKEYTAIPKGRNAI